MYFGVVEWCVRVSSCCVHTCGLVIFGGGYCGGGIVFVVCARDR